MSSGLALDHVFIMCDEGAPEASALEAMGLVEGEPNVHPGQGTSCRRFGFPAQYLELVWVRDPAEAQNERTRRTRLWERWSGRREGACPFGFVFRARVGCGPTPFRTWSYQPAYLPSEFAIEVGLDTSIAEPASFVLPAELSRPGGRPLQPTLEGRVMTHLRLATPAGPLVSEACHWAQSTGLLSTDVSDEYGLTVTFDDGTGSRRADMRPALPLVFTW